MTNPDYRHYVLIVDRSGSMHATAQDATGGIRQFIADQGQLSGRATLSFYQFDTVHDTVHDFAPLDTASSYTLSPRGGTALLDAVGFAVTQVGERLAAMGEGDRPGKVIVLIVTDGEENSSVEYTRSQVKELVTEQQDKYGWAFSYIGANVDAFAEGSSIGIAAASSMNYAASSAGTASAYAGLSASVTRYASGESFDVSYTDEEREDAGQA